MIEVRRGWSGRMDARRQLHAQARESLAEVSVLDARQQGLGLPDAARPGPGRGWP
jgi:hypothetical protein